MCLNIIMINVLIILPTCCVKDFLKGSAPQINVNRGHSVT